MSTKISEIPVFDIVESSLSKAFSYQEYRDLVTELAENDATTGPEQKEALIGYTKLNDRRMARWDKTLKTTEATVDKIKDLDRKMVWLVLTESWCGDASPSLPVMNKFAELSENIDLKVVLRDENTDLMHQFLTNGAMSIPKLIAIDVEQEKVVGTWGPRSSAATKMVEDYKKQHGTLTAEFKEDLQRWYNKDKGQNVTEDLLGLLTLE